MTLILHAGAEPITYDGLRQLETPQGTATHVPIAHHRIVDVVKHSLSYYGHEVSEEHYGATPDGQRFFGVLMLKSTYGDYTDMLGLRNSHDKSMPVGLAFGNSVFCCDNMAFSASAVVMRKHTAKARHDLPALISELVEPLSMQREAQGRKLLTYKATDLGDPAAHHAIMRMYKEDVINVQRIADVVNQWDAPTHDWGRKSVWRLFNAATFALQGKVAENPKATTQLHQIMDEICIA